MEKRRGKQAVKQREMKQLKKFPLTSKASSSSHHRSIWIIIIFFITYDVFREAKSTTIFISHSLLSSWLTPNPSNPHSSFIHLSFSQILNPFISGTQNRNLNPTHFQILYFTMTLLVFFVLFCFLGVSISCKYCRFKKNWRWNKQKLKSKPNTFLKFLFFTVLFYGFLFLRCQNQLMWRW